MEKIQNAMEGTRVNSAGRRASAKIDRATGEQIAELPQPTVDAVNSAVAAAKAAAPAWGRTPPLKQARMMFKFKAGAQFNFPTLD